MTEGHIRTTVIGLALAFLAIVAASTVISGNDPDEQAVADVMEGSGLSEAQAREFLAVEEAAQALFRAAEERYAETFVDAFFDHDNGGRATIAFREAAQDKLDELLLDWPGLEGHVVAIERSSSAAELRAIRDQIVEFVIDQRSDFRFAGYNPATGRIEVAIATEADIDELEAELQARFGDVVDVLYTESEGARPAGG